MSVDRITESLEISLDLKQLILQPVVRLDVEVQTLGFPMHRYQIFSISGRRKQIFLETRTTITHKNSTSYTMSCDNVTERYGDGTGNTAEENSSVFSVI